MVHLGRGGGLHPVSAGSLRAALFDGRRSANCTRPSAFSEDEQDWADPVRADVVPGARGPATGWAWHQPDSGGHRPDLGRQPGDPALEPGRRPAGSGPPRTTPAASCCWRPPRRRPAAEEVFRMLRNVGERGLLDQFPAVAGRPGARRPRSASRPAVERTPARTATTSATPVLRALADLQPRRHGRVQRRLRPHRSAVGAALRRLA